MKEEIENLTWTGDDYTSHQEDKDKIAALNKERKELKNRKDERIVLGYDLDKKLEKVKEKEKIERDILAIEQKISEAIVGSDQQKELILEKIKLRAALAKAQKKLGPSIVSRAIDRFREKKSRNVRR